MSRSRMVIWRLAGTVPVIASPAGLSCATFMSANCGRYFETGSSRVSAPSSTSMSVTAATIGLVIDAMLKIASVVIFDPATLSRKPNASK